MPARTRRTSREVQELRCTDRPRMNKGPEADRPKPPAKNDIARTASRARLVQAEKPHPLIVDTTAKLIAKRHLLSAREFQKLMGWASPRSLSRALTAQRVFFMDFSGERYFPAFFADPLYDRSHLGEISKALGGLPGGAKFQFFVSRKGSLDGRTPLAALRDGRFGKVLDLAHAFAEDRSVELEPDS